ncbi:putative Proline/betaine transporter [Cardinium endosymbiont cEper1 of Encarsia pergandiella]|nr:putative Proline/betaine transporter [Cardinium endosymbiont cEper1 of Encarsia pergandiella]
MADARNPLLSKAQLCIGMANLLIHFDNALYGYLVPIMAPLFFPKKELLVQLIWGYSPFIISFIAKPFGILFFSKMAGHKKETIVLRYTLLGIGISLIGLGCLPIYKGGSVWTVVLLWFARGSTESCAAGAYTISKIYLLKGVTLQQAKKLAAFYEVASMMGILLAGAVGFCFAWINDPLPYWRLPFLIAALSTLCNILFFSNQATETGEKTNCTAPKASPYLPLWSARKAIMRIAIVAGFGYVAYTIPFLFMSSFVPMVTTITYRAMMEYLPIFMVLDILLISWIGKVGQKYDHNNLMGVASGLTALSIIPLFAGLQNASILYITVVRCWFIFLGVIFSCFLTIWSKEQVVTHTPYMTIGLATVLGSSLFGKSATAICFYLFHKYHSPIAPACYIALLAFVTTLIMADSASE